MKSEKELFVEVLRIVGINEKWDGYQDAVNSYAERKHVEKTQLTDEELFDSFIEGGLFEAKFSKYYLIKKTLREIKNRLDESAVRNIKVGRN